MKIAVAGATGLTGETLLKLLPKSRLKYDDLVLLGSEQSVGKSVKVKGKSYEVELLSEDKFEGVDLAFFAVGDSLSEKYVPIALESGAIVIDKSAIFRLTEGVPLVVVGVNESDISTSRLIANPNCTTILLCHTLYPLLPFGPKEVYVSSYQSLSGAGRDTVDLFLDDIRKIKKKSMSNLNSPELAQVLKASPAIGAPSLLEFSEEKKIREETTKILNLDETEIYATAVRVPVVIGHSISCFVKFNYRASIEDIRLALEEHKFIELLPRDEVPDSTFAISVPDKVVIGRVRAYFEEKSACFFAVSNNLVLGAALNALLIAEYRTAIES